MELLALLAVFVVADILVLLGWSPDRRDRRDWQPRGGWKPNQPPR